jgi:microsomal dipeptidase-like Zn-dependent dipeptidase
MKLSNRIGLTMERMSWAKRFLVPALFLSFVSLFGAAQQSYAQSACGKDGERACCIGYLEYAPDNPPGGILSCDPGLKEADIGGCTDPNGCTCGGTNITLFGTGPGQSLGMCISTTSCGGVGQRACCNGNLETAVAGKLVPCQDGLQEIPGCDETTGNCYCSIPDEKSTGTCVQPTHCGGLGERACCTANQEFADNNSPNSCESGFVAIPGCSGDCTCGGLALVPANFVSIDTCTKSPIETITEPTIAATSTPVGPVSPSIPPSAYVDPADPLRGYADLHVHMFAHLAHGGTVVAGTPYDLNCPTATNGSTSEGAGGTCPTEIVPGTGGVNTALRQDYGTPLRVVSKGVDVPLVPANCDTYLNGLGSGQDSTINSFVCSNGSDAYVLHGGHGLNTLTGGGTNDAAASNFGAPVFNGWPQANSTIHQQVYYKWLERAWMGGLRLMTMFAVTNEALCKTNPTLFGADCTDSMTPIDAQLQAAKDFQTWLDNQNGGPGKGWFQIVTSPGQAKSVIQNGKLAVVLGIEVDNLFNCHKGADVGTPFEATVGLPVQYGTTCTTAYIDERVQHYYDMGVRHVFPVHNFDNAYGSPAAWQDPINVGNKGGEGDWWDTEDCANNPKNQSGYGFWLDPFIEEVALGLGFSQLGEPVYACGNNADGSTPDKIIQGCTSIISGYSTCNTHGMTSLGLHLIDQLMSHQMIIDVDHLSTRSLDDVLTKAENQTPKYTGIVATHVQFFDLYKSQYNPPNTDNYGRHERLRTNAQLLRIKNLGGMIAVMLKDDAQDTQNGFCASSFGLNTLCSAPVLSSGPKEGGKFTIDYGGFKNNCRYSTTEWYQAYRKGVDEMGGPVAMGSDFNGIAGHVGPRFGAASCGGDGPERSYQEKAAKLSTGNALYRNRLIYPFTLAGFGTFTKQVSGERTFDFNTDGLAHIGLLPDMLADIYNVDPNANLEPLFHSAEAYITMWGAIAPAQPTQFSVSAPATAVVGVPFSLTVTAEDSQSNPIGTYGGTVNFSSTDGLALLPASSTLTDGVGTFSVTLNTTGTQAITATDSAKSSLTGISNVITVNQPPTISSPAATTFTIGIGGSFQVTGSGFPAPTYTATGVPSFATLSPSGVLSGTAGTGTGGVYTIMISASNGILPNAVQTFTLTVNQPPAITSGNSVTFATSTLGTFTATATGFPAPTFTQNGAPAFISISPTGVLTGTPPVGAGGTYTLTMVATNLVSSTTQNFTLTVNQPLAFTSASGTTFMTGAQGSFPVTASGFPAPTYSATGLPAFVTLSAGGTLSSNGAVPAGVGGTYPITIKASNSVTNVLQNFTLTVNQPPAITTSSLPSLLTGFTTNLPFQLGTTGFPAASFFSVSGNLPTGVGLNGSTGQLTGMPAQGTGGNYPVMITAGNGVLPNATKNFVLTVNQPPVITSSNNTAFTYNILGSFTATASGFPAPSFTETGALPTGVTFNNATGVLSGKPAAGTGGVYPITINASNLVLPNASQSFTLRVQDFTITGGPTPQTISSGHSATYTITLSPTGGLTGSAILTCSGAPANSTCTVNTTNVVLNGTASTTVTLQSAKNVNHGTFTLTLTVALGNVVHSTNVVLTVK